MNGSDEHAPRVERGYGNIYTPHAGAMIIHVQRERGLANRTIVLTQRQVRVLRIGAVIVGVALAIGVVSWVFLASQAARVPFLTRRVSVLQHDVSRLDTLQRALNELEDRFRQVQKMMGASPSSVAPVASRTTEEPTATAAVTARPARSQTPNESSSRATQTIGTASTTSSAAPSSSSPGADSAVSAAATPPATPPAPADSAASPPPSR